MIRKVITSLIAASVISMSASTHTSSVRILYTTDVHGSFFPTDYITMQPATGSMARVATAIDSIRKSEGSHNVVLLDNGDILQGQPTVYFYNYIDTASRHIASEIYDFLSYDAATVGNHDIETGHDVYDRWRAETSTPVIAANVIDTTTGQPYFEPYRIINRGGMKIAVLGLLTPAIPAWLPENLWQGLRFDDMVSTAARWIPKIQDEESPDIIVGLFHSGHDASKKTGSYVENASAEVARNIPGFDIVLMGHDHQKYLDSVININGNKVYVINPANNAQAIGSVRITVGRDSNGNILSKEISPEIIDVSRLTPSQSFMDHFADHRQKVLGFVTRRLGEVTDSLHTADAFFGPSSFMTLLHDLQLEISGADVSFAAPLSFDGVIARGPLTVSDMFTLYKYENMLYTMELTGQEIKDYLEESYSLWTRQITDNQTHLIDFQQTDPTPEHNRLKNPSYNFDSAAGINYIVDVTRPKGQKITITGMSDGSTFDLSRRYKVAVNSYRGNGGGDLLTKGAGIPASDLKSRIIGATDKDLRYYLIKAIEQRGTVTPRIDANWLFIPADIAIPAAKTDRALLFGPQSSKNQK